MNATPTRTAVLRLIRESLEDDEPKNEIRQGNTDKPFLKLGIESLEVMNVLFEVEQAFGVEIPDAQAMTITVDELVTRVVGQNGQAVIGATEETE